MAKYKIGDTLWNAHCTHMQVPVICPVCFGKKKVDLILGNDEIISMDCTYCTRGIGTPSYGTVDEWMWSSDPDLVTVDSISISVTSSGEKAEYHSNHYIYHEESLFTSRDEALARGEELKKQYEEERNTRAEYIKKDKLKSYAWNAGYHRREAQRLRKDADYHERMAQVCKERSKDVTP